MKLNCVRALGIEPPLKEKEQKDNHSWNSCHLSRKGNLYWTASSQPPRRKVILTGMAGSLPVLGNARGSSLTAMITLLLSAWCILMLLNCTNTFYLIWDWVNQLRTVLIQINSQWRTWTTSIAFPKLKDLTCKTSMLCCQAINLAACEKLLMRYCYSYNILRKIFVKVQVTLFNECINSWHKFFRALPFLNIVLTESQLCILHFQIFLYSPFLALQ